VSQLTGASDGSIHDWPVGQAVHDCDWTVEYVPEAHIAGAADVVAQE
jgi:hypothetical protein